MHTAKKIFAVVATWPFLWGANGLCATNATVTLQFATEPTTGKFSPHHVLAVWVADGKGQHVKTLESYGKRYDKYLVEWRKATTGDGKNPVDAVTGATLKAHRTHVLEWNCRDKNGDLVPDGPYEMVVEFSEQNGKGPILRLKFDKGPNALTLTPKSEKYFNDVRLTYVPLAEVTGKKR